jgi:excalibur calcium-binding domain-containing protein
MRLLRIRRIAVPTFALALIAAAVLAQPAAAFRDRDCSDFSTQRQAQHFYNTHNPRRDPHHLDADRDGLACEDLP